MQKKTGTALAAAAAAFFAFGVVGGTPSIAFADVKCVGANACKGLSACASATNSCKGLNACKGQGFVMTPDGAACVTKGGKVAK